MVTRVHIADEQSRKSQKGCPDVIKVFKSSSFQLRLIRLTYCTAKVQGIPQFHERKSKSCNSLFDRNKRTPPV